MKPCHELLLTAADNGDVVAVEAALAGGANVHCQHDRAPRSAAQNGHARAVCVLLAVGADVHVIHDDLIDAIDQ